MIYVILYFLIGSIISGINYLHAHRIADPDDVVYLILVPPLWGLAFPCGLAWIIAQILNYIIYSRTDRINNVIKRLKGEKI